MPLVKAGRLRVLAVTRQTLTRFPDLPTLAEAGLPRYEATGWYGIVAPARAPQPIVMRLNQRIVEIRSLVDGPLEMARRCSCDSR